MLKESTQSLGLPLFLSRAFGAIRPRTLTAAIAPILCTTSFVYSTQRNVAFGYFFLALLAVICLQAATNLFNDALDFKKGSDTSARLGPTRVTASGLLEPRVVMALGFLFLVLSFLFATPMLWVAGIPGLAIAVVSAFFAYGYTGGPYPLAYNGLGELFVMVFFGWVACVGLGHLVFESQHVNELLLLGTQVGSLSTVLISVNNFRDFQEDRSHRKWTLAAMLGPQFAKYEICFFILLPFFMSYFWLDFSKPGALLVIVCFPFARKLMVDVFNETPSKNTNRLLAKSAQLQLMFAIALSIGFLIW